MAFKAEEYEASGELEKSLKIRHELMGMLPDDNVKHIHPGLNMQATFSRRGKFKRRIMNI